jgi:hypothetical protein
MGMIDDLIAIEDKKFTDTVDEIIEHAKRMAERRPWRDRAGIVHIVRPVEAVSLTEGFKNQIYGWSVLCSKKQRSPLKNTDIVVTCLQCLGAARDDA